MMHRTTLCLMAFCISIAVAVPFDGAYNAEKNLTHLANRQGNNAKPAPFKIDNWPDMAEQNCYVMLCPMEGKRVFTRGETDDDSSQKYRDSGAAAQPFADQASLAKYDTQRINDQCVSGEEFPWRSTQQGGAGSYVVGATTEQQRSQGGAIAAGYEQADIQFGEDFEITFENSQAPLGPYCTALFQDPPDRSLCNDDHEVTLYGQLVRLALFVFTRVVNSNPITFVNAADQKQRRDLSMDQTRAQL